MSRGCSVEGCNWKHKALGFCKKHYHQWTRGTLEQPRYQAPRPPVAARTAFKYEVEKINGVWHRRPTGSKGMWEEVVWEDRTHPVRESESLI